MSDFEMEGNELDKFEKMSEEELEKKKAEF